MRRRKKKDGVIGKWGIGGYSKDRKGDGEMGRKNPLPSNSQFLINFVKKYGMINRTDGHTNELKVDKN